MKIDSQITGFTQVTKPYALYDGTAKALNESYKYWCSSLLRTVTNLKCLYSRCQWFTPEPHPSASSIDTCLKHYLNQNINVDVQNIYYGHVPQRDLMRFACSMSCLINPHWLQWLNTEQSVSVNSLPCIDKLNCHIVKLLVALRVATIINRFWFCNIR